MEGSQSANLPPEGLGISSETIDEIIRERKEKSRAEKTKRKAQENVEPLNPTPGNPTGKNKKTQRNCAEDEKQHNSFPVGHGSTNAPYRIRKLRRDHPEIARRLDAGEFKSVAAAERASRGMAAAAQMQERVEEVKKATAEGREVEPLVLPSGRPTEQDNGAICTIPAPSRASSSGVSLRTQRKLDNLARKAPGQA